MPNYCANTVTISNPDPEKISAILKEIEKERPEIFDLIRPTPPEFQDSGWYEWRVRYWGTKWNPSEIEIYDQTPNSVRLWFLTAWSPPIDLYEYMTAQGYEIDAAYSEEGFGFRGTYTSADGDSSEDWNPDEERNEEGELI